MKKSWDEFLIALKTLILVNSLAFCDKFALFFYNKMIHIRYKLLGNLSTSDLPKSLSLFLEILNDSLEDCQDNKAWMDDEIEKLNSFKVSD